MSLLRGGSEVGGGGGPSNLLRLGVYALVAAQKVLLCLILLQVGFEGGLMPEAAEHAQKLAEAPGPSAHRDDRHHAPCLLTAVWPFCTAGGPAAPAYSAPAGPLDDPSDSLSSPRPPPAC